ncbi:sensor histidine kinase [Sporosarcina trichiuri]|uniref:sensor histidine kinase n=1 Tax=Sporosarcina trichiuri TaxID=3056445 RepID=UPI0025B4EA96|nr:HAMP domain-containing sensor histidine kinase [Sporosarcina sp. 0.2-SM1T-5]WJY26654.1 HAMP domain-containing sensor histidine kinase [Sporosarcina sp. 0.2-SM1T-5]
MKRFTPMLIWSMLAAIAIGGLVTFTSHGFSILFKDYTQSGQFQSHMDDFYRELGRNVLNPVELGEAEKKLTASQEEIEAYRTYYGSLASQVENIDMQYRDQIREAENQPEVKKALVEERDGKIADIRKNFEDDAYVEEKILQKKKYILSQILQDAKTESGSLAIPAAYELTPVAGGESVRRGDTAGTAPYEKEFNENTGYLKIDGQDLDGIDRMYEGTIQGELYNGEGISLSARDIDAIFPSHTLYKGTVHVPASAFDKGGVLYEEVKEYNSLKIMLLLSGVAGIAALVSLLTIWKFKWTWFVDLPFTDRYNALKIDVKAAVFLFLLVNVLSMANGISGRLNMMAFGEYSFNPVRGAIYFLLNAVIIAGLTFQVGNAIVQYRQPGRFASEMRDSYMMKFLEYSRAVFQNRSIAIQTLLLLFGFFLAGVGFVVGAMEPVLFVIYAFCVLFLGLPVLFFYMRRMGYLGKILTATDEMAAGRLNRDIPVIGRSPFAVHAANLNNLREGVERSVSSQAKSERMKTELITNVSHDLRTPLTSIITYTDLLKNPGLSETERAEYVDVLDRKSQRLKTLIEDLFEVSKMSSGTMELYKQRVDLSQLVRQAVGEHSERMAKIPLDFRVAVPEEPVPAIVDGQRWWRMLDNLIGNALKYSLPGTRVYVTLREIGGTAEFTIKNITAYELEENVDELYERFKRGDASRHTEGSGLGLAIAQSIVDMHGGSMDIQVDGDLFKVTVRVPAAL